MFDFILLGVAILFASLNSVFLHNIDFSEKGLVVRFNFIGSCIWAVILFCLGGRLELNKSVLVYGTLYAFAQVFFLIFKAKAMSLGPVSLTTLIGNMSLILSTVCGVLIWNERVCAIQIIGIILLIISIIICTYEKNSEKNNAAWIFCCVLFFIFAGAVGIIFKFFSKTGENINNMMFFSSLIMIALLFPLSLLGKEKGQTKSRYTHTFIIKLVICGIISCLYNRINIYLSGAMDSIIFFPSFNGSVIILSTLFGVILFKEKLKAKQIIGITLGLISILSIGIFKA